MISNFFSYTTKKKKKHEDIYDLSDAIDWWWWLMYLRLDKLFYSISKVRLPAS